MRMQDQDGDWLDARLASAVYIPDDGFTSQVVGRLPKQPVSAFRPRQAILFVSGLGAAVLLLAHIIGLAKMVDHQAAGYSWVPAVNHGLNILLQPTGLAAMAAVVVLAGFALIPVVQRAV